jgi:hypothetical protein
VTLWFLREGIAMSTTDLPEPTYQPKSPFLSKPLLLVAIICILFCCFGFIIIPGGLFVVGIQKSRDANARAITADHLKQCACAAHGAHDQFKYFPPFYGYFGQMHPPGSQQASFFVHLLPYMEQGAFYNMCISDPNGATKDVIVPHYLSPSDYSQVNNGAGAVNFAVNLRLWQTPKLTNLQPPALAPFEGEGRPIKVRMPSTLNSTFNPDGTGNTLLFATKLQVCGASPSTLINAQPVFAGTSSGPYFGWTHATPANQSLASTNLGWQPAPKTPACIADANLAQSFFPQAIQVALCDASVRSISSSLTFGTWTMALTPNGGENMPLNWAD